MSQEPNDEAKSDTIRIEEHRAFQRSAQNFIEVQIGSNGAGSRTIRGSGYRPKGRKGRSTLFNNRRTGIRR